MEDRGRLSGVYIRRLQHGILLCIYLMVLPALNTSCNTTERRTVCEGGYKTFPTDVPPTVTDLDVSKNKLSTIEEHTLSPFQLLRKINMSKNEIVNIHNYAFFLLVDLETLDLSFNHIKVISDYILFNNAKLKWFSIAHNTLQSTPQLQSKSLLYFNVSASGIHYANETSFLGLETIEVLDLSFNNLTEVRRHTFDALTSLHILDVSNNKLINMNFIKSDCALSLTYLDVSSNDITVLDLSTFQTLLTLRNIHLQNNPWKCNEVMKTVYETALKSELTLNLECISSNNTKIPWHYWYYSMNDSESENTKDKTNSSFTNSRIPNSEFHHNFNQSCKSCDTFYLIILTLSALNVPLCAIVVSIVIWRMRNPR